MKTLLFRWDKICNFNIRILINVSLFAYKFTSISLIKHFNKFDWNKTTNFHIAKLLLAATNHSTCIWVILHCQQERQYSLRRLEDIFNIFHVWRRYSASPMIHWWLNLPVTLATVFRFSLANAAEHGTVFIVPKSESLDEYSQVIKSEHDGVQFRWRKWFFSPSLPPSHALPWIYIHPRGYRLRTLLISADVDVF